MPNEEKVTFKVGEEVYDIPTTEREAFLSDFKDAVEVKSFIVDKDTFDIPLEEVDLFLADMPNAKPLGLGKQESAPTRSGGGDMNLPSQSEGLGAMEVSPDEPQDIQMLQMQEMDAQQKITQEQQRAFQEQQKLTTRQKKAYQIGQTLEKLPTRIEAKRVSDIDLSAEDKKFISGVSQGSFDQKYYDQNWKQMFKKMFDVNPMDMGIDKEASKAVLASGYGLSTSKEKLDKYVEGYIKQRDPKGIFAPRIQTQGITQDPEYLKLEKAYKKAQKDFEQNIEPVKKKLEVTKTFVDFQKDINLGAGVKMKAADVQKAVDDKINITVGGQVAQQLYNAKKSGDEKAIKEAEKVYFGDIDNEIADIDIALKNHERDFGKDPKFDAAMNEQKAILNAQKQNFFKKPEEIEAQLSLVKPEYTTFQSAMNTLTPQERLKMYMYSRLDSFRKLAQKNGLSEEQTNELLASGSGTLSTWFERATGQISGKDMNTMKDIMKEVHSIYPAAMLNVQPVSNERTNVVDRAANSFKTTFGAMAMNDDEKAGNVINALGLTETRDKILPSSEQALETQSKELTSGERAADIVGQTFAYVPEFMVGTGAANLVLRGVMTGAKYAKAPALYNSAKWMRGTTLPAKMANRGLSFEVTDKIFNTGEGALSGAAGALAEPLLGAAGKFGGRAMKTLFGDKADDFFKEIGKWNLSKKLKQGTSETFEETAENIVGLWQESENGEAFRKALAEQYGEIDNATWNLLSPFALGIGMDAGSTMGRRLVDAYGKGRSDLTPDQQAVGDQVVTDFTKKQNESAQQMMLEVISDVDTKDLQESKAEAEKDFDGLQKMYDAYVASGANGVLEMDIDGDKITIHSLGEFNAVMDGHRDMLAAIEVELGKRAVAAKEQSKTAAEQDTDSAVEGDMAAKKDEIERRRQEELKQRVIYNRKPTVEDGEFFLIEDSGKIRYKINDNTGRLQFLYDGLWSNVGRGTGEYIILNTAEKSGFEKDEDKINAKYDAELKALKEAAVEQEVAEEEVVEPSTVDKGQVSGEAKVEPDALKDVAKKEESAIGKTFRDNYNRTFEVKGENTGILTLEDVDTGKILRKRKDEVMSNFKEIEEESVSDNVKTITESIPKGGELKGITEVTVSESGEEVSYGTKTNKTSVSVKGMSADDIKQEIAFEKKVLEKSKKEIENFNEDEVRSAKGMTAEEKESAIKMNKQAILNNEKIEKIVIPFYEKHLELATAEPIAPPVSKEATADVGGEKAPSVSKEGSGGVGGDVENRKKKQLEIINKENPAPNNDNTWVRSVEDILSPEEAFKDDDNFMGTPDFTIQDAKEALENGEIIVYSSYPIKDGVFVTPSKMEATLYAGNKTPYSKRVKLTDVAWIDSNQGQYAEVKATPEAKPEKVAEKGEEKVSDAKKLADRIRSKKFGGTMVVLDFGISKTVYNGAIEFMAKQVEKGTKLGNAIANTIKWIDGQMQGAKWNKGAFAKYMNDTYTMKLNDGRTVEVVRDDTKETAEVINGWYQPIEQKILDTKQATQPANKWAEKLRSKEDEDLWTGVREFLESKGTQSVSKKELLDFIKDNRVEIVEVVKGGKEGIAEQRNYAKKRMEEMGYEKVTEEDIDNFLRGSKDVDNTKYSQYQLEGDKENYAEKLVILPSKEVNITEFVDTNADYIIEAYKKSGKLVVEC